MTNEAKYSAEVFIETMRLLYPSIYRTRLHTLTHMFLCYGTAYEWRDGKLQDEPGYEAEGFDKIAKKVLKGTAPSVEEMYLKHTTQTAKDYLKKYTPSGETLEKTVQYFSKMDADLDAKPRSFYLSEEYSPICHIPDNVTPDWLACCLEMLHEMENAKTDYDEISILSPEEKKRFFEHKKISKKERTERDKVASDILAEMGVPANREEQEKQRRIWEEHYSPKARAKRANLENKKAIEVAKKVLSDLRKRKLIAS